MEPTVTAALIGAGAKLFKTFIQVWRTSQGTDDKQKSVKKWISKNYDSLRDCLSSGSVKLLAAIDGGKRRRAADLLKEVYPKYGSKKRGLRLLKSEFHYRLQFLILLGVLRYLPVPRNYEITRLGVAFLEQARAQKHYPGIL